MKIRSLAKLLIFFLILTPFLAVFIYPAKVEAGTFSQTYVRLDRVKAAATNVSGLVCAQTPSSDSGTEGKVLVTFPTGFTLGIATTFDSSITNLPSGATAWPSISAKASDVTGQVVTFTSADLTATSTLYCFRWSGTGSVQNPSAANNLSGSIATQTGASVAVDSGNYAVSVIADDQISVTATVPLIFTLALSDVSMPLGSLSTSTVTSSTSRTLSIGTNAAAGWIAWVKGANGSSTVGSLHSTVANADISAPDSCANNTPTDLTSTTGYVLDVDITTDGGGTGTITQASNFGAEYAGSNSTSGGSVCTDLQPIAASNGTTDGDLLTLTARAKVTATQAAASDYADTLTVIATGRF